MIQSRYEDRFLEWVATAAESGLRLSVFLLQRLNCQYSARFLKRLIERHGCQINGRVERFASTLIGRGDRVSLNLNLSGEFFCPLDRVKVPYGQYSHLLSKNSPSVFTLETSRILYEDDALCVYNKPAGVNSDEAGLLSLLKRLDSRLRLVHRLDRDTTGVLLLAKSDAVLEYLVEQFKRFQVQKSYCAIVDGLVASNKGIVENYLGKKRCYAGQTIWGSVPPEKGLHARTDWQTLRRGEKATLLACIPTTGRTHQLRVHLAEMGHPILGDGQYGIHFDCPYIPERHLLHAKMISFHHPATGDWRTVKAPMPDDWKKAEQTLFRTMKKLRYE